MPKSGQGTGWAAQELCRHLDDFLAGRAAMPDFQREFMGQYLRLPPHALPESEQPLWRTVYELLTRAAPDPIDPSARSQGVIGEAELRARLRQLETGR